MLHYIILFQIYKISEKKHFNLNNCYKISNKKYIVYIYIHMSKLSYHILSKLKNQYDKYYLKEIDIPLKSNLIQHGYIYIIYNISYSIFNYKNPFKIGRTNNPEKRLTQHSCSQILDCNYVYISELCSDYVLADSLIKQDLRKYKINRELYDIKLEDAINIISRIVNNVNNPIDLRTISDDSSEYILLKYDSID